MNSRYLQLTHKDFGHVFITESDQQIAEVSFTRPKNIMLHESMLLKKAQKQITEYLSGHRQKFQLPIKLEGTEFQVKAWKALLDIPYGQTISYQQQALAINNPKAVRAVGTANSKNPLAIIIPCHRVIGKNKHLTGYAGGIDKKKFLLKLEGHLL